MRLLSHLQGGKYAWPSRPWSYSDVYGAVLLARFLRIAEQLERIELADRFRELVEARIRGVRADIAPELFQPDVLGGGELARPRRRR